MTIAVVEALRDLVQIPSVNPMGRNVAGDIYYESRLTNHLERLLTDMGLRCERHTVAPGRDNLLARLDAPSPPGGESRLLMLEAHQDTVPVDGMTIDPWSGQHVEGRVYGRGACDIKGGMACMLTAVSRLAEQQPADMPTIVLACSVNEEYGFSGAANLRNVWESGKSSLLPRRPDAILVAEPTELNVVVTHKGIIRWRCHTKGRAAHSSSPDLGQNAIYQMGRLIAAVQQFEEKVIAEIEPHPMLGRPTLNVGTIHGGISVNTVPDRCTIELERRLLPDEDPDAAYRQMVEHINQKCGEEVAAEHEFPYMSSAGLTDHHNRALAQQLADVAHELGIPSRPIGVAFGTDASELAADGVPSVVFGPGSVEQAHTRDEWVAVEQLEKATEIIYQFASRGRTNDNLLPSTRTRQV